MLLVFAMAAAVAITLYSELPRLVFESQRIQEQELIDRGEEYQRAIQLYVRKNKKYPASLDDLEQGGAGIRFLRRRYTDPMTGEDEWRVIHIDAGGFYTDSLIHKPQGEQEKEKAENTFITEGAAFGSTGRARGAGGLAAVGAGRRGASDRPVVTAQQYQQPAGMMPEAPPILPDGGQAVGQPGEPGYQQPDPNQPGYQQPDPNQPGAYPGQAPGYPQYPGYGQAGFGQTGMPGRAQQYPHPAGFPGQQGQPGQFPQPGQLPPGFVPGQAQVYGQQMPVGGAAPTPIQGVPGLPGPYGQLPQAVQAPQQPMQPQYVPFGSSGYAPGATPPQQVDPTAAPLAPGQPAGSGFPGAGGASPFGQTSNPALQAIQNSLFSPRPGGLPGTSAPGLAGGEGFGGGVAGVATKLEADSIKIYNERAKYQEWEFLYDVRQEQMQQTAAAARGAGMDTGPGGNQNPFGGQQGGQAPFGDGSSFGPGSSSGLGSPFGGAQGSGSFGGPPMPRPPGGARTR